MKSHMKSVHCAAVKFSTSKSATKLPKSSAIPTTFPTVVMQVVWTRARELSGEQKLSHAADTTAK